MMQHGDRHQQETAKHNHFQKHRHVESRGDGDKRYCPGRRMRHPQKQHQAERQPDADGTRKPEPRKGIGRDTADDRRQQIATDDVCRLRQRAFRLAEQQHRARPERRDQQRQACIDRQQTDHDHGGNGAQTGFQMMRDRALWLMSPEKMSERMLHGATITKIADIMSIKMIFSSVNAEFLAIGGDFALEMLLPKALARTVRSLKPFQTILFDTTFDLRHDSRANRRDGGLAPQERS